MSNVQVDLEPQPAAPTPRHAAPVEPVPFSLWRTETWNMRVIAAAGYWACTRLLIIMSVFYSHENANGEVHRLYQKWARILQDGSFPIGDPTWQYPPGAAGVILSPVLVPGLNYVQAFILVTLLADAVVLVALLRAGTRPGRTIAGAWVWVLVLPLMQYIPYARYDVIVTLFAVLALLTVGRRAWLGGGFAAVGAMIKVWPAFAVFGAPRGREIKSIVLGFVASAAALTAIAAYFLTGAFDFLHEQGSRGVEFESLGGCALLVGKMLGQPGHIEYRYGSLEFLGPHAGLVGKALLGLSVVGFCWLLLWRLRARTFGPATAADAALTAVLVFVTTSRVISPQYFIWLAGLGAVCLTYRQTTQRAVVALLLVATALTTVEFPFFFQQIISGHVGFTLVLVLRNVLLLVATVVSGVNLWRSTVPRRR
jgi:hypothetical protein